MSIKTDNLHLFQFTQMLFLNIICVKRSVACATDLFFNNVQIKMVKANLEPIQVANYFFKYFFIRYY